MNNAEVWLVVSPSVGDPFFPGAAEVGSFAVHVAVLGKVSWYTDTAKATCVYPDAEGAQTVLVVMPDGTTKTAVLQPDAARSARHNASTRRAKAPAAPECAATNPRSADLCPQI